MPDNDTEIETFYDRDCLICSREIEWLRGKDSKGRSIHDMNRAGHCGMN
jgi:predicted DCC family thiol-disulfide oxidoreductase YuxK